MGWWSKDILGGDSPLDWKASLYDKLGINYFSEEQGIKTHDGYGLITPDDMNRIAQNNLIQYVLDSTQKSFEEWGECHSRSIGMQVLSLMILKSGAKMTKKNKKELSKWIKLDEWAKEDYERKDNIDDLLSAIKEYDSTPMKYQGKGLFQKLAETISGTEIEPSGFKNI
tara:strand:+ start:344 stop:850 length:507 start_codon:yes stop_codon:yes gene_type:complete